MMSSLTGMLPLVLMFVVLYFVMILPQMKKRKEHRPRRAPLTKDEQVATAAALAAAFLNAAFGFCLGCEVYLLVKRTTTKRTTTEGATA